MSDLKTNLQEILQEKQNKIVPENIKKDVQIFDVTGTYEGSGSSTAGVKLFESIEDMQSDMTAKNGDKAVIYTMEQVSMKTTNQFNYLYLPDTIVRPIDEDWNSPNLDLSDGSYMTLSYTNYEEGDMGIYLDRRLMESSRAYILYSIISDDTNRTYTRTESKYYLIPFGPASMDNVLDTEDYHGIKAYNIQYQGTYIYEDGWIPLPKNINATTETIVNGYNADTDKGIINGALSYEVEINNGDDSTDIQQKIKAAYTGCGFAKIIINRTDDWAGWIPIDMGNIGANSNMGYVTIDNPIEVELKYGANVTLPNDGLFCGTSQMGYTVINFVIDNNSSQADPGKVFGAFPQGRDIRYTIWNNRGTIDQTIPVGMDCKLLLGEANTTLVNVSGYEFTNQYNKLSLIYMIHKAPSITDGKVLTIPTDMYAACTESEWQILLDKGWTITQT